MARKTVEVETTGQAYLELLRERGIEYFFANAGTDFAPLIDAFARFAEQGKTTPKPITVPHENAAVAMAHGYYMITGKPQVVMVHVNVGTGNAINGIINASRDNVPILFSAGRTPLTEGDFRRAQSISIGHKKRSIRPVCCGSMSSGTMSCATSRSWKRWWTGLWRSP
jgi:acetolactate synthase-1/2/3 large subunit